MATRSSTGSPAGVGSPTYPGLMASDYLTLDQAAERADIDPAALEQAFRRGQVIGAAYSADGRWTITTKDLDAWPGNPT